MRDNTRNVFDPREPLLVIPSPIVTMTQADAGLAVKACPIIVRPDWANIVAVAVFTNSEMINAHQCAIIVTHHIHSKRTAKKKVAGSWRVVTGIGPTDQKHVFTVQWPAPEEAKINGNDPVVPAEAAPVT